MLMEQLDEYFALMNQRVMQQNVQLAERVNQLEQQVSILMLSCSQQHEQLAMEINELKYAMKQRK